MGTAGFGGSFAPIVQYEKWEIHPVFPHFSYFRLCQNLAPNLLAPLCGVALLLWSSIQFRMPASVAKYPMILLILLKIDKKSSMLLGLLLVHSCQRHPQQLLGNLATYQAHDVVLHIVPGEEIHTAVPEDLFMDDDKMLAVICPTVGGNHCFVTISDNGLHFCQVSTIMFQNAVF